MVCLVKLNNAARRRRELGHWIDLGTRRRGTGGDIQNNWTVSDLAFGQLDKAVMVRVICDRGKGRRDGGRDPVGAESVDMNGVRLVGFQTGGVDIDRQIRAVEKYRGITGVTPEWLIDPRVLIKRARSR